MSIGVNSIGSVIGGAAPLRSIAPVKGQDKKVQIHGLDGNSGIGKPIYEQFDILDISKQAAKALQSIVSTVASKQSDIANGNNNKCDGESCSESGKRSVKGSDEKGNSIPERILGTNTNILEDSQKNISAASKFRADIELQTILSVNILA